MKIVAPINKIEEVEAIIEQGADELYCGVLPHPWKEKYLNVASPNRREWSAANLRSFDELKKVVEIAHAFHRPVYLTLNALYTEEQYPSLLMQVKEAERAKVDAFIIGDLGFLLFLKEARFNSAIQISNTATVFNAETVKFFKELGAKRIILPRDLMLWEMEELLASESNMEFEVFIMNSGCKNIDGFCTFQHGVNEVLHPHLWGVSKKINLDHYLLESIRRLPKCLSASLKGNIFGIDSACLLNYRVSLVSEVTPSKDNPDVRKAVSKSFNLLSGADPCGACDLYRLKKMGVDSLKIVGRNYPTAKKMQDVRFLKSALSYLEDSPNIGEEEFKGQVKLKYREVYKTSCKEICYRFN